MPRSAATVTERPWCGSRAATVCSGGTVAVVTVRVVRADGPPFRSIRVPVHSGAVEVPSASVTVSVTVRVPGEV